MCHLQLVPHQVGPTWSALLAADWEGSTEGTLPQRYGAALSVLPSAFWHPLQDAQS